MDTKAELLLWNKKLLVVRDEVAKQTRARTG